MEKKKILPLISKEEFTAVLNFIKDMDNKFNTLADSMEKLAVGFYVDFYPNLSYNKQILDLLDILMKEPSHEHSLISYFIYDLGFGTSDHAKDAVVFLNNAKVFDLSSPELLYDALVEINFTHPDLYYNEIPKQKHKIDELFNFTSTKETDK